MAEKRCSTAGSSRRQKVFVMLEDVSGTLQRPTASGYILPAGRATMNQTPEYSNSEELTGSLDVMEQFRNAVGPGECSIPMYVRVPKDGSKMQGHALYEALMGSAQEPNTVLAEVGTGGVTISATTVPVADVTGGVLPPRGVVTIGSEKIRYLDVTKDSSGAVTALTNCVRGYAKTTAAAHDAADVITLASRVFIQDNCRPSVSIWIQDDHTVRFASGGIVTQATVPQTKEGGQHCDVTLQFRQMGWCGVSLLGSAPTGGTLAVVFEDDSKAAEAYAVGGIIQNSTKKDDNSGAGYTVTAVDYEAGTITVSPAPSGWAVDDKIIPWLPDEQPVGDPLQSADTRVFISGKGGKLTEGSLSIGTPTNFTSEIGDEFPGENADDTRDITMDNGLIFRSQDIVALPRGYNGSEAAISVVLGGTAGGSLAFVMPRVKLNMPDVGEDNGFLTLVRSGAVLGTKGNDSLIIVQE